MSNSTSDVSTVTSESGSDAGADFPTTFSSIESSNSSGSGKSLPATPPRSARIIGISYRDSPEIHFSPTIAEATRTIKNTKSEKDARFKMFASKEEGLRYYAMNPVLACGEAVCDGYRSPFKSLHPRELTKFSKAITEGAKNPIANVEVLRMMDENPQHFIDLSKDLPSIVHAGMRFNAMHICAKDGNLAIAREIMRRVRDTNYLTSVYDTTHSVELTSRSLIDKFLNMPDKIQNQSPALVAAKFGHYDVVAFLTSFLQCDIQFDKKTLIELCCKSVKNRHQRHRMYDLFRHPMNVYCITLYAERDDLAMPFFAITTRFPRPHITSEEKRQLFVTKNCNAWGVTDVNGTVRISNDAAPFTPSTPSSSASTLESYQPVAMMGVYSNRGGACVAYRKLHCYTKSREAEEFRQDPVQLRDYIKRAIIKEAEADAVAVFEPHNSGMSYDLTDAASRKLVQGVEAVADSMDNMKTSSNEIALDYYGEWTKESEEEFINDVYTDNWSTAPSSPNPSR